MEVITIDFETKGIVGNALVNPPRPCGVAVRFPDEDASSYYPVWDTYPFGPDYGAGFYVLQRAWFDYPEVPKVFHNAPFDLSVAAEWLGLKWPRWDLIHDTMYLVFHNNPYGALDLKGAAEEVLGEPPDERNELRDWIIANVKCKPSEWGAYICEAPFEICEPYANGDVDRTYRLFVHIMQKMADGELYAESV